jgi:hypothetical protein
MTMTELRRPAAADGPAVQRLARAAGALHHTRASRDGGGRR